MSYGAAAAATTNETFSHESPAGRAPTRPVTLVSARSGAGELAVEVAGRGNPVVLVHGWGVDRRMWAHQAAAFRRHFTTITYDRRGCGQSTAPADHAQVLQAAARAGVHVSCVGSITDRPGLIVLDDTGRPLPDLPKGFDHFA